MVSLIVLGACILGSVALICFKGIRVKYDKTFTIDDKRIQAQLDHEELKALEDKLNKQVQLKSANDKEDGEEAVGPMDSVIAEIHEIFGPEPEDKGGSYGRNI